MRMPPGGEDGTAPQLSVHDPLASSTDIGGPASCDGPVPRVNVCGFGHHVSIVTGGLGLEHSQHPTEQNCDARGI